MKHPRPFLVWLSLGLSLWAAVGCSRSPSADSDYAATGAKGNDACISRVRAAAHAMTQPEPSVDYVAAEMEGVIKARTKSQALMHYDGYRAQLTTPGDRVTQVTFELVEAKPTVEQVSEEFGRPKLAHKGLLYEYESALTGSTIRILAEPVSTPADKGTLVRRIVLEGARVR